MDHRKILEIAFHDPPHSKHEKIAIAFQNPQIMSICQDIRSKCTACGKEEDCTCLGSNKCPSTYLDIIDIQNIMLKLYSGISQWKQYLY